MPTRVQRTVDRLNGNTALQLPLPPVTAAGADLSGDHPLFDVVPEALAELRTALDRSETHYADVPGIAPLRERVAEMLNAQGLPVHAGDGLIITHGEQEGRFIAVQTAARLGARIILPAVVHPGAAKTAAIALTTVDRVPLDMTTMAPELGALREALRAGGKAAAYVESPNRLTGKVIDRKTVEAIADAVKASDAVIVWDASLATWVPDGTDVAMIGTLPGMAERTLTLGTLWSGAGVDGWLAAYLAGPPALFGQARSFKQIIAICTTTPAQWGVLGAMRSGDSVHRRRLAALAKIRADAARQAKDAVLPGEAVTVLAVRRPARANLAALGGHPMAGEAFGAPGILRFTVTPGGEIVNAVATLTGGKAVRSRAAGKTPTKARAPRQARARRQARVQAAASKIKRKTSKIKPKTAKMRRTTAKRPASPRSARSRATKTRRGGRR
jgi:aspartate/methionine/tyrosine aminotransferase